MRIARLSDVVRIGVGAFAGAGLILTASGCLATRSWVNDQLRPITGQQEQFETQLNNLHLERRLVLDSSNGPTFKSGSAALSGNAKREIDQFVGDMEGSTPGSASAQSGRVFVVAGYTDSVGHEDYNYELGQRRATSVAGYLVGKKGLDPMQVRVISYGASKPIDDNGTRERSAKESASRDSRLPGKDRDLKLIRLATFDRLQPPREFAVALRQSPNCSWRSRPSGSLCTARRGVIPSPGGRRLKVRDPIQRASASASGICQIDKTAISSRVNFPLIPL